MSKCDKCKYPHDIRKWPCEDCLQGDRFEPKPPTNADRIRAMSDEELAEWIVHKTEGNGFDGYEEVVNAWLDWLKEEVDDGDNY